MSSETLAQILDQQERPASTSADAFRQGMRLLAGACTIITSAAYGAGACEWAGLTATAVVSLSAAPPRLLVCVNRNVWAHGLIMKTGAMGVNVLSTENAALATRFAGGQCDPKEKFAEGKWVLGTSGAPLLADGLASFDCRVGEIVAGASHDIFIGDVLSVRVADEPKSPLIYFNGNFLS